MSTFITGTTGYLGSYVATNLLRKYPQKLALLVRASSKDEAARRLWHSLQLHMDFDEFFEHLSKRVEIYLGDITQDQLGILPKDRDRLEGSIDSIIHVAASLNRKSAKACFNVNLRGTLEMVKLARAAHDQHGLRRFSEVSTVAVCGQRQNEIVSEDQSIQWDRSDYDPYARTKKFGEHMVHELLSDIPKTIFRPSIILGDSRFPETTQFDMVRAFAWLAYLPMLPLDGNWRADIVPADFVGRAVAELHQKKDSWYDTYHLSAGAKAPTFRQIVDALAEAGLRMPHMFLPRLEPPFRGLVNMLSRTPRGLGVSRPASLLKVFLPYLTFNTVFENQRVVEELGEEPTCFTEYAYELLQFAREGEFQYPYREWPKDVKAQKVA